MKIIREQITFDEMRQEVARELSVQKRVFPRWIQEGKIAKETAHFRMLVFEALVFHLHDEVKRREPQGDLFE
ncbi:MAG: hypothetical protein M3Q33_01440 [Acidobacteriota bacterium]|nr:hypothetical protein [Acidobacteriota bacterium]